MMNSPILCDLGRTGIRFCLNQGHPINVSSKDVVERRLNEFAGPRPFQRALKAFLEERRVDPTGLELRLSLPCEIYDANFHFDNLTAEWQFSRDDILKEFGFARVRAWNDAEAAFYSIFVLRGEADGRRYCEEISHGSGFREGRLVILNPGTGLGAAAAYLERRDGGHFWFPIPSEFGSTPVRWENEELSEILDTIAAHPDRERVMRRLRLERAIPLQEAIKRREFLPSAIGLVHIYHALPDEQYGEVSNITQALAIIHKAKAVDSEDSRAVQAVRLFCFALAQSVRDFGATFTARAGIFLAGRLITALGADGLQRFGFFDELFNSAEANTYPANVPMHLITHPYPELVGIARFSAIPKERQKGGRFQPGQVEYGTGGGT